MVGRLGKSRGVNGEIWIVPLTDFPDRFLGLKEIYLREADGWKICTISSTRMVSGKPVMKFRGIDSKEDAARLTNRELAVTREQLVKLPDDRFYVFDLDGCRVFDRTSGELLGTVVEVRNYPANDVYVIEDNDGRTMMLPAVRAYVTEVNLAERRITIERSGLYSPSEEEAV